MASWQDVGHKECWLHNRALCKQGSTYPVDFNPLCHSLTSKCMFYTPICWQDGFVEFFREADPESSVRNTLMTVVGVAGIGATLAMLIRWTLWTVKDLTSTSLTWQEGYCSNGCNGGPHKRIQSTFSSLTHGASDICHLSYQDGLQQQQWKTRNNLIYKEIYFCNKCKKCMSMQIKIVLGCKPTGF